MPYVNEAHAAAQNAPIQLSSVLAYTDASLRLKPMGSFKTSTPKHSPTYAGQHIVLRVPGSRQRGTQQSLDSAILDLEEYKQRKKTSCSGCSRASASGHAQAAE